MNWVKAVSMSMLFWSSCTVHSLWWHPESLSLDLGHHILSISAILIESCPQCPCCYDVETHSFASAFVMHSTRARACTAVPLWDARVSHPQPNTCDALCCACWQSHTLQLLLMAAMHWGSLWTWVCPWIVSLSCIVSSLGATCNISLMSPVAAPNLHRPSIHYCHPSVWAIPPTAD